MVEVLQGGSFLREGIPYFNMRKPLSIGMFVRARFETGLFRFPSGEPAHAAWLSRRLPGKLISAGSCGCASGGQPGMSAHPTAFRVSVRRDRANPVLCRARPGAAHKRGRELAPAMRRGAGPPGGSRLSPAARGRSPRTCTRSPRPSRRARAPRRRWPCTRSCPPRPAPRGGGGAWRCSRPP